MYDPGLLATNRIESVSPAPCPCINRAWVVVAFGIAGGSTGPAGIGFVVSTTSAECGRFASLFVNRITTVQFAGTVNVNLPLLKPLKFRPLFSGVRPDVSWNVAILAVLSTVSQVQSIAGDCGVWATHTGAASMNATRNGDGLVMRASYLSTRPDCKAHIHVASWSRLIKTIPRCIDDHRADV